jgi:hypothetical protein
MNGGKAGARAKARTLGRAFRDGRGPVKGIVG